MLLCDYSLLLSPDVSYTSNILTRFKIPQMLVDRLFVFKLVVSCCGCTICL